MQATSTTISLCVLFLLLAVPPTLPAKNGGDSATSSKKELRELKKANKARHNRDRDDGTCELEISCRGEAIVTEAGEVAGPVKLPIRGPRGPPGEAGSNGERGHDGLPGLPGLPGKRTVT